MKNKNGFTLIELLAALVVVGVLAIFAVPKVLKTLEISRDKVYVSDAKKMVSLAEYKMRSESSKIERPTLGNSIILYLNYLDNGDFDDAPYNGEYQKDASFVMVTAVENPNGDGVSLKYTAVLIENVDGGYRGIHTDYDNLKSDNATVRVQYFTNNAVNKWIGITVGSGSNPDGFTNVTLICRSDGCVNSV